MSADVASSDRAAASSRPASRQWPLWAGFVLVALNLRLIFATIGPLLEPLGLGFASTLLVTTLPLALLGLCAMPGVRLRQWLGEERALALGLALLILGCGARGFGEAGLILGTVLASAGVAVMNVIMPTLARKRFGPRRLGLVMGVYALMLGMGAVIGAGLSLPLFQWLGADARAAYGSLGLWALPAALALLAWLPQLRHAADAERPGDGPAAATVPVYRNRIAWSITLFFGLQVLNLYVFLPWMPTLLADRGATPRAAALIFSISQVGLMAASFAAPLLAARAGDQRPHIAATVLLCLAGTLGLRYAPAGTAMLWASLLGLGQGGGLALGTFLFVARAASADTAARISAMAQTVGYAIAVAGPLLIGTLHHATGDWNAPVLILSTLLVLQLVVALPAGRDTRV